MDPYAAVIREFFQLLGELWFKRIELELQLFAEALDRWLDDLFEQPTPDWRESFAEFLAAQEAEGRIVVPKSRADLIEFLEGWARTVDWSALQVGVAPVESSEAERPFVISVIPDVSGPGPKPATAKTGSPPVVATKPRLPADSRGTWIIGKKGDGVFQYNDSAVNRKAGIAGAKVRFKGQYIAKGGLPAETYYGGSAAEATVTIETVAGTSADSAAADAAMRKKLGDPAWRRPQRYQWNHAGGPRSKTMELVDADFHEAVAHKGPAAGPRAARRVAKVLPGKGTRVKGKRAMGKGAVGRAMAVVAVYLTAKEALQAAGILQPNYYVFEEATYYFVANDESVFIVWSAGWFSSAKREFIAGPRKGETEKLAKGQVAAYQKIAEAKFGKYIRGTWFREPRFIPGTDRKSLPLTEEQYGVPVEVGWIDEEGVHRYPVPKPGRA